MSNTNEQRAKQLGMPFGTASHRLRKSILFSFVQRLNLDTCYKCSVKIEKIEELSIEHKEPWFDRDVSKFWDLDNIAFSHLKCNVPHVRGGIKLRKKCPEGTAWCYACKDFRPLAEFYKDKAKWNGINSACITHHLELTNARKRIVRHKD
jgi:hypothetical protein